MTAVAVTELCWKRMRPYAMPELRLMDGNKVVLTVFYVNDAWRLHIGNSDSSPYFDLTAKLEAQACVEGYHRFCAISRREKQRLERLLLMPLQEPYPGALF